MIKEKFKKVTTLALAGVLAVGMMAGSVSQVSAATPEDEAKITVGKTLTINGTKFPDIETFEFELEAVQGYTNPNISTTVDGQTIPASQVPMPTGAANNKIKKTVGDFTTTQTGDSASAKTRKDAFGNIKYTTAGYYLYTLKEVIPTPKVSGVEYDESTYYVVVYVVNKVDGNGDTTDGVYVKSITSWHNKKGSNAHAPNLKDIAKNGKTNGDDDSGDNNGADPADNDTFGNTGEQRYDDLGKVGVTPPETMNELDATLFWNKQEMHDVILKKNVKGNLGDRTKQFEFTVTLTGLEKGGEYAIQKTGVTYTYTAVTGEAAKAAPTVTYYTTNTGTDVVVEDVEGLADDATVYTKSVKSSPQLVSATKGSVDNSADKITANANGECTFLVKIADDQGIVIKNMPNNATYKIEEAASNHAPSYDITSSRTASEFIYTPVRVGDISTEPAAPDEPVITYYTSNDGTDVVVEDLEALEEDDTVYKKDPNPDAPVIVKKHNDTDGEKEVSLATEIETVNATDGDITVKYTNDRNLETITGIPSAAIYFGMAGLIFLIAFMAIRNRKDEELQEM